MKKGEISLNVGHLKRVLPGYESLLALIAFADAGDSVQAARLLQISQPALSFHLKKLENQLEFSIFAFAGKKKVLTKIGLAYVEKVKAMLTEFSRAHEQMSRTALSLNAQQIQVAGRRELLLPLLEFPFPGKVEFIQASSQEAVHRLREHQIDLAVTMKVPSSSELVARRFFESGFKLIMPREWKLSHAELEKDLSKHPVIAYGNHHAYLTDYLKAVQGPDAENSKGLKIARVVEDWFSVVELARSGLGWAVIPESWELHTPLVIEKMIPTTQLARQKVYLVFRREDRKTEWVKVLEDWLKSIQTEKEDT
jgi:DNA-binding transcriptional LysR family regulator